MSCCIEKRLEARLNLAFKAAVEERRVPELVAIALGRNGDVLYKGAFGSVNISDEVRSTIDIFDTCEIFSLTKIVTCVAALQLLEKGKLDLDDPVEKYLPSFKELPVMEGFSEQGDPIFRPPKTKATIRHLMTHTSGLAYDFFDEDHRRYRTGRQNGKERRKSNRMQPRTVSKHRSHLIRGQRTLMESV